MGLLNKAQLLKKLEEIYSHIDFQASMKVLWDLASADFSAVAFVDIEEVASFVKSNWIEADNSKVALVVPNFLGTMVAKKYANLLPRKLASNTKIFQDYESALAWLD